jgi:FkbM family methyltransferase
MNFTRALNNLLDRYFGLRISPSPDARLSAARKKIFSESEVSIVLDVGANAGQYATRIRGEGYKGQIISFEPSPVYNELVSKAATDPRWICSKFAISNKDGFSDFYVASNSYLSSSLLPPEGILTQGFDIRFTRGELVETKTLVNFFKAANLNEEFYLKIDVQGAEMLVLEGAEDILDLCVAIEFESALSALYAGESLHYILSNWLLKRNFVPVQLVPTHYDEFLRTVSLDSIFVKIH